MSTLANFYRRLPIRVKRACSKCRFFKLYNFFITDRFRTIKIGGLEYNIDLYTYVGSSLYNFGVYEVATHRLMEKYLKKGMTAVDIGASIGAHTLPMAKLVGKNGWVHAFEPSKFLFQDLSKHIDQNGFENIKAVRVGLSDRSGSEIIRMERLGRLDGGLLDQPCEKTAVLTLDNYVKELNIKKIDFIKIDTDGFEYRIFKGGIKTLKRDKPVMVVEFRKSTVIKLIDLLKNIGYRFFVESTEKEYTEEQLIKEVEKGVTNVLVK